MDIRNWGLGQIMQLPDHCFGSRWPLGVQLATAQDTVLYDMIESALPDRCVIWELGINVKMATVRPGGIAIAIGDHQPVNDAEFDAMEPLFKCTELFKGSADEVELFTQHGILVMSMRYPVEAQGRRLVVRFENYTAGATQLFLWVVISSVPTEVPDCLLSV